MGFYISIFIIVYLLVGISAATKIKNKAKNYYIAGKSLPLWIAMLTLSAQSLDSNASLGNATFAYQSGFWAGAILPLGLGTALFLTGRFFAEPLNKMNLLTLPDFYYERYGKAVELIVSVLTVISFSILLAGNLAGISILANYIWGIPYNISVICVSVLILLYTIPGGLFSVAWTDILQISIAVIGFISGFLWLIGSHGTELLFNTLQSVSFSPMYSINEGALPNWAAFLALGLGDIVALDFMERVFSAKTPKVAKTSCYLAGTITIAVGIPITLMGMMAFALYGEAATNSIFLKFVSEQMPFGITVLIFSGIIGASMSTADGAILATSTVITRNIVGRHFPKIVTRDRLLGLSRLAALPIAGLAVLFAIVRPDPGILLVLAFDIVFAGCLIPLAFGIYWKESSPFAALVSIIAATVSRLILFFVIPEAYAGADTLIPPVISLFLFVGLSKLKARKKSGPALGVGQSAE